MSDVSSVRTRPPDIQNPPNNPGGPNSNHGAEQSQKAAEEAQKAQAEAQAKAQQAEAQKAAAQAIHDTPILTLPQDFMGVIDSIVKEGFETAKPPEGGKTGDQDAEGGMAQKNFAQDAKDLQTLKQFMKEAKYLIENQGMSVAQMFNMIKVEQGGAFWQKLQQVLQKGLLPEKGLPQKGDAAQELGRAGAEGFKSLAAGAAGAEAGRSPGKAILELLKAEINPQNQADSFLAALAILNKEGMNDSAGRLRSYLRRRGGVPEEAINYYFTEQKKEIFQGPFPKEVIQPVNWWYILLALGAFGTSMGLGLNILEATLMGIGVAALMFFLSFIYKR